MTHSTHIHLYRISLDGKDQFWFHKEKDKKAFRQDMLQFAEACKPLDNKTVVSYLPHFLKSHGYAEINMMVEDTYRARVASTGSRLIEEG